MAFITLQDSNEIAAIDAEVRALRRDLPWRFYQRLPVVRDELASRLNRAPTAVELAAALHVKEADLAQMERFAALPDYDAGGFKLYDISDRARPRLIAEEPRVDLVGGGRHLGLRQFGTVRQRLAHGVLQRLGG